MVSASATMGSPELPVVVAIDDPAVWRLLYRLVSDVPELFRGRLAPVRPVMQRVELDVGHPEPGGELRCKRRLPSPARPFDDDSPSGHG